MEVLATAKVAGPFRRRLEAAQRMRREREYKWVAIQRHDETALARYRLARGAGVLAG